MADDDPPLSPSQMEKLIQFQDLTRIDDINRCRDLLESHHWDIEVAVQDTLNIQEGSPSVFRPPSQQPPPVVTHPADQRQEGTLNTLDRTTLTPSNNKTQKREYGQVTDVRLIRPDPRRFVTDPLGDVVNFITQYETKYGLVHPVFYQGTYSQALNDAKQELKFLLVYLHGDDHQDTPEFCRLTLSNREVIEFINQTMLFWACSVNSAEGYRVSQALRENGYPFVVVIVLRENRMTVVARMEGPVKPQELIVWLQQVMQDNESSLIVARADRHERSLNQTIRRQQDEAYLQSLQADQEKERRRMEEIRRRELEEQARQDNERQAQRHKEEIRLMKVELSDQVPGEPPPNAADTIRVMIKLPQGTRLERRFYRHQSLKYLYYFVFCHESSPDEFEIVTNFPRRALRCQPTPENPEPPSFAQAGLGRSEMLFVHDLEA